MIPSGSGGAASTGRASRGERALLVLTPAVAMAAVALGLQVGAPASVRAAIVYGSPRSVNGPGFAWQVVVFDDDRGAREPAAGVPVDVQARAGDASSSWHGVTSPDGVAEALLAMPEATPTDAVTLDVTSSAAPMARGKAAAPPTLDRQALRDASWLPFARREGALALDVALLGQRAAPGAPADLWVLATDATTRSPVARVRVTPESDTSLLPPAAPETLDGVTDTRGWAHVRVTPVGLAVTPTLDARAPDGRSGNWTGGLFMSPGAPTIATRARWPPDEPIALDITTPTERAVAYVEIDDARGRCWAAAAALDAQSDGTSHATLDAGRLAPGLYWAVASSDPAGAAYVGSGTMVRPFFVATTDETALSLGTDPAACAAPADPRDTPGAVSSCLALSVHVPPSRWTALDGFVARRALDRRARTNGLAIALGALAVAILLEGLLLFRAAAGHRGRTVAVAVLVGLLGFALLAAFIARV